VRGIPAWAPSRLGCSCPQACDSTLNATLGKKLATYQSPDFALVIGALRAAPPHSPCGKALPYRKLLNSFRGSAAVRCLTLALSGAEELRKTDSGSALGKTEPYPRSLFGALNPLRGVTASSRGLSFGQKAKQSNLLTAHRVESIKCDTQRSRSGRWAGSSQSPFSHVRRMQQ
jgi:hypothetical protein